MDALVVPPAVCGRLLKYLDVPTERMAFLLAAAAEDGRRWTVADEMYLADGADYAYQSPHGTALADSVRPHVLGWASASGNALVEVHSHGALSRRTTFSPTDLEGLAEVVPQMLWRLRVRPYTALVLGDGDIDALTWERKGELPTPPSVVVLGGRTLAPTAIALDVLTREGTR